ncbi:LTA synthase family protein [Bacteroides pyogenes]|uniref:LTA synthase family protein n=3 Tax=Bacteroides pyogenes TaxID=310300 RepID=A0A5D3FF85_9BACE|nr:LTA synthase family protein [Bacteroides pyogenes]MCE9105997.1 LTA synthase family protein [Bacteroides pyogenes]MDY4249724.1 LTA synthase family protein [Bacteroides pyogenes]TYK35419.1 LTA synthase family protein [Bacteroides pyogenes]TYK46674.1 LTA synthase family protein [Bacteroides pyogenes]
MKSRKILSLFIGCLFLKFLLFDLDWCLNTTFSSFSFPQTYFSKFLLASLLAVPLTFIRTRWYCAIVASLVDILLVVNLMYFRTYFTSIPWDSYFLAGNLADFSDSVLSSLRWSDLLFPLSTVLFFVLIRGQKLGDRLKENLSRSLKFLAVCIGAPAFVLGVIFAFYGGYKKAYEALLIDYQTCGTPIYTIPGSLYYEHIQDKTEYTPEIKKEIEDWLSKQPRRQELPYKIEARDNCIIILAESFESFVLEKVVEGKEITPYLNRLLKEDNVLYAPYVQSQVKGARSIDGQLLLHTGLLPVNFGAYSARFPHHTYYTIDKAFKEKHDGGVTRCFTVDKKVVWNVAIVAQDFGYDKLLDKPFFVLDEKTGPRKRLGDVSFLRQCGEKLLTEELFQTGGHTLVQCVTYSGHGPFIIPEKSKRVHFSERIPTLLKNYIEVANYTDYAIGKFVEFLRSHPKFDSTMIVITGDHEGFGTSRSGLYADPVGKDIISPQRFTPFIVLNSPVSLRYEKVMGQIDMYPTLLDLIGADDYPWRGLGRSILSPDKKGFAISSQMEIIGDTTGVSPAELQHARDAWRVSDLMICCDYFAR